MHKGGHRSGGCVLTCRMADIVATEGKVCCKKGEQVEVPALSCMGSLLVGEFVRCVVREGREPEWGDPLWRTPSMVSCFPVGAEAATRARQPRCCVNESSFGELMRSRLVMSRSLQLLTSNEEFLEARAISSC